MIDAKEYFMKYLSWPAMTVTKEEGTPSPVYREALPLMPKLTVQEEAGMGNPAAMEELGERYMYGLDSMPQDTRRAIVWLNRALEEGNPEAAEKLAEIYRTEQYGCQDLNKFFGLMSIAAEAGNVMAITNMAHAYYVGKEFFGGVGPEKDRAVSLDCSLAAYDRAKEMLLVVDTPDRSKGFDDMKDQLYTCYVRVVCAAAKQLIEGDGVDVDLPRAKALLEEAQAFFADLTHYSYQAFDKLLERC